MRPTLEIQADKLDERAERVACPTLSASKLFMEASRSREKDLNRGVDLASMQEDKLDRFSIAKRRVEIDNGIETR